VERANIQILSSYLSFFLYGNRTLRKTPGFLMLNRKALLRRRYSTFSGALSTRIIYSFFQVGFERVIKPIPLPNEQHIPAAPDRFHLNFLLHIHLLSLCGDKYGPLFGLGETYRLFECIFINFCEYVNNAAMEK
jgi:hypothetical protein